jgi:hypothetical protein
MREFELIVELVKSCFAVWLSKPNSHSFLLNKL